MFWGEMVLAVEGDRSHGRNALLEEFPSRERVYLAMLSRGYYGTLPDTTARKFGKGRSLFSFPLSILLPS